MAGTYMTTLISEYGFAGRGGTSQFRVDPERPAARYKV